MMAKGHFRYVFSPYVYYQKWNHLANSIHHLPVNIVFVHFSTQPSPQAIQTPISRARKCRLKRNHSWGICVGNFNVVVFPMKSWWVLVSICIGVTNHVWDANFKSAFLAFRSCYVKIMKLRNQRKLLSWMESFISQVLHHLNSKTICPLNFHMPYYILILLTWLDP